MKLGELIDSVLLKVSGGRLSPDVDTHRVDIQVLCGPAIAYHMDMYLKEQKRADLMQYRLTGTMSGSNLASYLNTYYLTPDRDETRDLYKIDLPGRLIPIPQSPSIATLSPIQGFATYTYVDGPGDLAGLDSMGLVFYWHEIFENKSRLYVTGLGDPVCQHVVKMIMNPFDLCNEDEIAAPDQILFRAIDSLVSHFTGQVSIFQDIKMTDTHERTTG